MFFHCFRGLGVPGESKNIAFSLLFQGFGGGGARGKKNKKNNTFGDGLREPKPWFSFVFQCFRGLGSLGAWESPGAERSLEPAWGASVWRAWRGVCARTGTGIGTGISIGISIGTSIGTSISICIGIGIGIGLGIGIGIGMCTGIGIGMRTGIGIGINIGIGVV